MLLRSGFDIYPLKLKVFICSVLSLCMSLLVTVFVYASILIVCVTVVYVRVLIVGMSLMLIVSGMSQWLIVLLQCVTLVDKFFVTVEDGCCGCLCIGHCCRHFSVHFTALQVTIWCLSLLIAEALHMSC